MLPVSIHRGIITSKIPAIWINIYIYIWINTYIYTHKYTHIYTYKYTYVTSKYWSWNKYIKNSSCLNKYIYMNKYISIHPSIYKHIHIYIHINIHILPVSIDRGINTSKIPAVWINPFFSWRHLGIVFRKKDRFLSKCLTFPTLANPYKYKRIDIYVYAIHTYTYITIYTYLCKCIIYRSIYCIS
jgi:hypothetical protein